MSKRMTSSDAKRNWIVAETKRLTSLGLTPSEIAIQLKVKRNLILRLVDLNYGEELVGN